MNAPDSSLVSSLRTAMPHAHVEATRHSDVAAIRLPWWPWSAARARDERARWLRRCNEALPIAFVRRDTLWEKASAVDPADRQWQEGSWAILLRESSKSDVPTTLDDIVTDDGYIAALRRQLDAVVLVVSWPDDTEWSVSVDADRARHFARGFDSSHLLVGADSAGIRRLPDG